MNTTRPKIPSTKRVLIAGCGDVGTALGLRLARSGHTVFGLRRDPSGLPAPIVPVAADLGSSDLAAQLPPELDHVVYAAAPSGGTEAAYQTIYVDGVRHVLDALGRMWRASSHSGDGVRRVILLSSTAVYADAEGAWVDEDTPALADGFRGAKVLEGEALVRRFGGLGQGCGIVFRLGGIYGPGRTRLIDVVRSGRARVPVQEPGAPAVWTNRIHRDDAAGAAEHLLALSDPAPCYLGVDLEPAPLEDVYQWLAQHLGAPQPVADPHLTRDRANKRCSSARLQSSGYSFMYPTFREGYRALVSEIN